MKSTPSGTSRSRRPTQAAVLLELSQAQVDRVLRDASATDQISMLLTGLPSLHDLRALVREQRHTPRLSRSLLSGLALLASMPQDGSYMTLTALASALGMSMSTTHRYVSTLLVAGLVERDPHTREYRLAHGC